MTADLIIKVTNTSNHYIQEAENYLKKLGYSVNTTYSNPVLIHDCIISDSVFILTSETSSSWISQDQYQTIKYAHEHCLPVYVIYKKKGTNVLNIYKTDAKIAGSNLKSCYAKLYNFSKVQFDAYTMAKELPHHLTFPNSNDDDSNNDETIVEIYNLNNTSLEYNEEELLLVLY